MKPDRRRLVDSIDRQGALDFLSQTVRFASTGGSPGETALGRFLADRMMALGLATDLQQVEGERFNAIGRLAGSGGGRSLMYNGHLDTNPVSAGWTVDPLAGLVDDQFIYGIGVSNTKASNAAAFWAVKTLAEQGLRLRGDIILAYVVGELDGGIGTLHTLEHGLRADCFLCGEPTDLAALTVHAGAFNFVIELTGATRHVSKREEAVDALAAACVLAQRINAMTFSGAATADHRVVNRAHVGQMRAALTPEFNESRPPQVADFARLVGTGRYSASQTQAGALGDLRQMLGQLESEFPGLKGRVYAKDAAEGRPTMEPFEVSREAPIVRALNQAYETVRGRPQPTGAVPPPCFFITDAAHLWRRGGMEGVVCGAGGKFNTMPDERVDIADYLDAIRIYLLTMLEICS